MSYNPATKEKQDLARKNEQLLAEAIGGTYLVDNEPFDVVKGTVAIEVKTIISGKNPKITMHKDSLARKVKGARKMKMRAITVVFDARADKSNPTVYYRRGIGSFRLTSMTMLANVSAVSGVL